MISENSCLLPNDTCITKSLQRPEERFVFFVTAPTSLRFHHLAPRGWGLHISNNCWNMLQCFLELILLKISYHAVKPSDTKKRKHCLVAAKLRCKTRWETALGETRLDILAGRPIKSSCIWHAKVSGFNIHRDFSQWSNIESHVWFT